MEIESGIPIPTKETKYAVLGKLAVGESVLINVPRSSSLSKTIAILSAKTGRVFTRKKLEGGVRVWRIEPSAKKVRVKKHAGGHLNLLSITDTQRHLDGA